MTHCYESVLIDTTDGFQFKVYANSHPKGFIIAKPKYIPTDMVDFTGLKKRFIFSKSMTRFNLFNKKEIVLANLEALKSKFPDYYYTSETHDNWFLGVPENKIKKIYDSKQGVKELMNVPVADLDPYLKATRGLIDLITQSGVSLENIGISHSTLLCNYTPGKSDIDVLIYGKENGWKVIAFMETAQHPSLKWKSADEWAKYYKDRIVSTQYSEREYVSNMVSKKDDGFFDGNVFSLFCVENPDEVWYDWNQKHTPVATVKIQGTVIDAYNSIVRPGYYDLGNTQIISGHEPVPIKRIVTFSRPFVLQAKKGQKVEACGLLEKVNDKDKEYYQVVLGYFDTYTSDRGEQEYMKALIE